MRKQSELDSNQEQLLNNVSKALNIENKHVLAHLLETYYTDYGSHIDTLKALIQIKEKLQSETNKLHETISNLQEKHEDLQIQLAYSNKVSQHLKERTIEDRRLYEQLNMKLHERSELDTTILEAIEIIKSKTKNEDKINAQKVNEISDLMSYIAYTIDEYVKHKTNYKKIDFGEYHKTYVDFKKHKEIYLREMEEDTEFKNYKLYEDDDNTFIGYDDEELEVKKEIQETKFLKSNTQKRKEMLMLIIKIMMYSAIAVIGGALLIDGVVLLYKALVTAKEHIFTLISWIKS